MAASVFTNLLLPLPTPEAWREKLDAAGAAALDVEKARVAEFQARIDALEARVTALEEARWKQ